MVDLATASVTPLPPLCGGPHQAAYSPDGRWGAIPCALDDQLLLLVALSPAAAPESALPTPLVQPLNVAWAPDSGRLWATLFRQGAVVAVDTAGRELARAPHPGGPADLAVTPNGRRLLVPLRDDFLVLVLDAATLATLDRWVVGDAPNPHGVVIAPDGATAFITHEGTARSPGGVVALRTADGSLLWHTTGGAFTLDLRWLAAPSPTLSTPDLP